MITDSNPALTVRQMRVIWRDTFVIDEAPADFLEKTRERLVKLACYRANRFSSRREKPPRLRVVERAARGVARIGYDDLVRYQFDDIQIADLSPALSRFRIAPDKLDRSQIRQAARMAADRGGWFEITPMLLLHRSGIGIMQYHAVFNAPLGDPDRPLPGYSPEEAIERVRLGIDTQLLRLPDSWLDFLPGEPAERAIKLLPNQQVTVAGLRDLAQCFAAFVGETGDPEEAPRPTGSTSVILLQTEPAPSTDFPAFVRRYGAELRGIGAMDQFYRERADWLVTRELDDNLSADSEVAVYLLGNSELILYNDLLEEVTTSVRRRLRVGEEQAMTYLYSHFTILLEWIYLQDAILRAYLHKLDALVSGMPKRKEMIGTLRGALADLIQYQEDITPFATRIEFLERARRYHKLDVLAERFERKQELLIYYSQEFYDYREARATEFLNWLAGILTGAALADLIVTLLGISATSQTALYLSITLASIALVLAIMALLLRQR